MKQIKAYKDSKGKLHENKEDYLVAEYKINKDKFIILHEQFLALVTAGPEYHYKILKDLTNSLYSTLKKYNGSMDKVNEEIDIRMKNIIEAKNIINKRKYQFNDDSFSSDNWNESPGSWRGIDAQDIGLPNC